MQIIPQQPHNGIFSKMYYCFKYFNHFPFFFYYLLEKIFFNKGYLNSPKSLYLVLWIKNYSRITSLILGGNLFCWNKYIKSYYVSFIQMTSKCVMLDGVNLRCLHFCPCFCYYFWWNLNQVIYVSQFTNSSVIWLCYVKACIIFSIKCFE